MKNKQIEKTLRFNKLTVVNLDKASLSKVAGGEDSDPGSTCKFCVTEDIFCEPTKTMCTGSAC